MSIITDEMVEKAVAAGDGILEAFEMRAALEAVANDIVDVCLKAAEDAAGYQSALAAIRLLKTKDPA